MPCWPPTPRRAVAATAELAPDHVSLFVLEVEGKTLLSHRAGRGSLGLPNDDLVADLYARTVEALAAIGIRRYAISSCARPEKESRLYAERMRDSLAAGACASPTPGVLLSNEVFRAFV